MRPRRGIETDPWNLTRLRAQRDGGVSPKPSAKADPVETGVGSAAPVVPSPHLHLARLQPDTMFDHSMERSS
jgi:hypothetical protein